MLFRYKNIRFFSLDKKFKSDFHVIELKKLSIDLIYNQDRFESI